MPTAKDSSPDDGSTLLSALRDEFSAKDGMIFDAHGGAWIVWKTSELYAWWHSFEDQCSVPLQRKLMNACADQEEYLLGLNQTLSTGWLLRKRKQKSARDQRWARYGWGLIDLNKDVLQTLLFAPMASGVALATKEQQADERMKLEWQQASQRTISLEFTSAPSNLAPAPEAPLMPWSMPHQQGFNPPQFLEELEWMNASWSVGGEPTCLFPMDAFTRLFHTCRAYPNSVSKEQQQAWLTPDFDAGTRSVFLMIVASMATLVNGGERPIYIENSSSWASLSAHYLSPNGWGHPLSVESLTTEHGVRFTLESGSTLPFLIGWLVAMWERGHGKASKFRLEKLQNQWSLEVDSRLAYN